ncbi:MAG: hypothetical protein INQ03_04605 [Candidatus Heimdallarchaeota archaeon]|nr:hypothetical protein [Candidatus Heimdallarchaeota archaeon]
MGLSEKVYFFCQTVTADNYVISQEDLDLLDQFIDTINEIEDNSIVEQYYYTLVRINYQQKTINAQKYIELALYQLPDDYHAELLMMSAMLYLENNHVEEAEKQFFLAFQKQGDESLELQWSEFTGYTQEKKHLLYISLIPYFRGLDPKKYYSCLVFQLRCILATMNSKIVLDVNSDLESLFYEAPEMELDKLASIRKQTLLAGITVEIFDLSTLYYHLSNVFILNSDYENAKNFAEGSYSLQEDAFYKDRIRVLNNLAVISRFIGNFEDIKEYNDEMLKILVDYGTTKENIDYLMNQATLQQSMLEFEQADEVINRAKKLIEEQSDPIDEFVIAHISAKNLMYKFHLELALDSFNNVDLSMNVPDAMKSYLLYYRVLLQNYLGRQLDSAELLKIYNCYDLESTYRLRNLMANLDHQYWFSKPDNQMIQELLSSNIKQPDIILSIEILILRLDIKFNIADLHDTSQILKTCPLTICTRLTELLYSLYTLKENNFSETDIFAALNALTLPQEKQHIPNIIKHFMSRDFGSLKKEILDLLDAKFISHYHELNFGRIERPVNSLDLKVQYNKIMDLFAKNANIENQVVELLAFICKDAESELYINLKALLVMHYFRNAVEVMDELYFLADEHIMDLWNIYPWEYPPWDPTEPCSIDIKIRVELYHFIKDYVHQASPKDFISLLMFQLRRIENSAYIRQSKMEKLIPAFEYLWQRRTIIEHEILATLRLSEIETKGDNSSIRVVDLGTLAHLTGIAYDVSGKPQKAFEYYEIASNLRKSLHFLDYAGTIGNLARIYTNCKEFDQAKEHYSEMYQLYLEHGREKDLIGFYLTYSGVYIDLRDYEKALSLINQSLLLAEKHQDQAWFIRGLLYKGRVLNYKGTIEDAIPIFELAPYNANDGIMSSYLKSFFYYYLIMDYLYMSNFSRVDSLLKEYEVISHDNDHIAFQYFISKLSVDLARDQFETNVLSDLKIWLDKGILVPHLIERIRIIVTILSIKGVNISVLDLSKIQLPCAELSDCTSVPQLLFTLYHSDFRYEKDLVENTLQRFNKGKNDTLIEAYEHRGKEELMREILYMIREIQFTHVYELT